MSAVPLAVRWVSRGPRTGIYIWVPIIERWQWIEVTPSGVTSIIVRELPDEPAQQLVPISDVEATIDAYRDALFDAGLRRPDRAVHEQAKYAVLAELRDASSLQGVATEDVRESPLTMQDLRRGYDG